MCAGASSGLHHDFHDNLYVLLRGRKCFRLYPPDQAKRMYTHGRIAKVHANGRIVYADQASRDAPMACGFSCLALCNKCHKAPAQSKAFAACEQPWLMSTRRSQDETNADGSGADEAAAWHERVAAESDIAAAQEAVQRSEKASNRILSWHGTACAEVLQAAFQLGGGW